MSNFLRIVFALFMGYVLSAPFTDRIEMDFMATDWSNAWTYLIIILAAFLFTFVVVVSDAVFNAY